MASLANETVKVLEDSCVSPTPGSVPSTSLPLSFIDISCLGHPAMQRLIFYEFPHPTSYFVQTTLPALKASLSLTLQHFFPLAAKVLVPPPPQLPYFLYSDGDSVPLTANESTADFTHLTANHNARHVQELKALVPHLPPIRMSSTNGCLEKPVMAIRVTVFPVVGISIGIAFCHSVADGMSLSHFLKSWASVHRCEGDLTCLNNALPNFERDQIDPLGLASMCMEDRRESMGSIPTTPNSPIDKFLVTFVIKRSQVKLLKDWVAKRWIKENKSEPLRISTFVVTCAYIWVCLVKSQALASVADQGDELCYCTFPANCRERLKLPATYFGNCFDLRFVSAKKSELLGENGVVEAAGTIGREIMELDEGLLKGADKWSSKLQAICKAGNHTVSTFASPKFGMYKIDFGWGRARKIEAVNVGTSGSLCLVSIYESGEDEGGVEFGLGFAPNHDLDGFNAIFNHGLSGSYFQP